MRIQEKHWLIRPVANLLLHSALHDGQPNTLHSKQQGVEVEDFPCGTQQINMNFPEQENTYHIWWYSSKNKKC